MNAITATFMNIFGGKRKFVWIAGGLLVFITILSRGISIKHWESLGWELTGYHPIVPVLVLLWGTLYLTVLYIRKVFYPSLWIIGIASLIYGGVLFWVIHL